MTKDQVKAVVNQLFVILETKIGTGHPLEVAALKWLNVQADAEIDNLVAELAGSGQ